MSGESIKVGDKMTICMLAQRCGHFHSNTVVEGVGDVANGYGCNHPDQEEIDHGIGKCTTHSCPLASEVDTDTGDDIMEIHTLPGVEKEPEVQNTVLEDARNLRKGICPKCGYSDCSMRKTTDMVYHYLGEEEKSSQGTTRLVHFKCNYCGHEYGDEIGSKKDSDEVKKNHSGSSPKEMQEPCNLNSIRAEVMEGAVVQHSCEDVNEGITNIVLRKGSDCYTVQVVSGKSMDTKGVMEAYHVGTYGDDERKCCPSCGDRGGDNGERVTFKSLSPSESTEHELGYCKNCKQVIFIVKEGLVELSDKEFRAVERILIHGIQHIKDKDENIERLRYGLQALGGAILTVGRENTPEWMNFIQKDITTVEELLESLPPSNKPSPGGMKRACSCLTCVGHGGDHKDMASPCYGCADDGLYGNWRDPKDGPHPPPRNCTTCLDEGKDASDKNTACSKCADDHPHGFGLWRPKDYTSPFKTMDEAKACVEKNKKPILELVCPKYDMENPTEADLEECGDICENHWGCHTYRHLRGTRTDNGYTECKACKDGPCNFKTKGEGAMKRMADCQAKLYEKQWHCDNCGQLEENIKGVDEEPIDYTGEHCGFCQEGEYKLSKEE